MSDQEVENLNNYVNEMDARFTAALAEMHDRMKELEKRMECHEWLYNSEQVEGKEELREAIAFIRQKKLQKRYSNDLGDGGEQ